MATPKTVAFHTLGCKLNYSETSSMGRLFEEAGYQETAFKNPADIYVINTCSVTDFADRKCRKTVRKALRQSPDAFVVVVGCYAQLKPDEIAEIPGVDLVLGAAQKFRILDYVDDLSKAPSKGLVVAGDVKEANIFVNAFSFGDRTRSFLKVQDGCNYKCSFCTIPQARGASRSNTVESIVANAQEIAAMGIKEIVLTGVNIGDFGNGTEVIEGLKPKKEALFIDLIRALDEVEGIERFRISSIEPNLLTQEIIDFVAQSKRFVPHFHIPLQSGNNKQLRAMRRRYKRELYAERVAAIRQAMPHCCIGVDVIVGFPGETDEDFKETQLFLEQLDISYLHVFTYSERANTPAAEMDHVVPMHTRRVRNEQLRQLSIKKRRQFYQQHANTHQVVLVEAKEVDGKMFGFTANYIKVALEHDASLVNQLVPVQLGNIDLEAEELQVNATRTSPVQS
jgi:threonylcarbamoyladenosine tRNA methylthiotransferase MtaB